MRWHRTSWLALLGLAALATTALGQTRTGTIDGTVRDATGQVLPGVSVTLEGAALVTPQVTTTSATGTYRFLALNPGTYALRFELSGFNTQRNEGVRVDIGSNTAINVTLQLSSVEEVVTVVGESPMVDVKTNVTGANFDEQLLQDVPSARDVWSLLEHQAPGVTTNRLDVGGSETGLQAVYGARGTAWGQNSYYLNGVNVTCPSALGASGYYYDYDSFEEVQVETGGHPAEVNAPGVYMNMVTKSGGNDFAGGAGFFYQNDSTQGSNIDKALEDRGATASAFDFLSDGNAQLGGPIVKDRSNFYFSWRDERVHRYVPGFEDANGVALTEDTDMWQFLVRNTTQINENNRLGVEWHHMSYWKPNRGAAGNRPPESTWIEDDTFDIVQAGWTSTLSPNALLDVRFSHLKVFFPTYIQPDATGQSGYDSVLNQYSGPRNQDVERDRRRYAFKGDLTYFKEQWAGGDHEFKFGLELDWNPVINNTKVVDDVELRFRNGAADQVRLYNTPLISKESLNQQSFFVSDIITAGARATIKLGLRFDRYYGYLPEQNSPAGSWVGPRQFPERTGLLDVASFAPRLGLTLALDDAAKSVLKTSWGRYYHQFPTGFPNFANQNGLLFDTYRWNDLNGDSLFQDGEQGQLLSVGASSIRTIDPDFKHPYTDEFTLGVEREVSSTLAASAVFVYRKGNNLNDAIDAGVPFSAYTPVDVTDPGPDNVLGTGDDGGVITVYNQNLDTLGQNSLFLTNPEGNDSNYKGVELSLTKRLGGNWQGLVSYTYSDTEAYSGGGADSGGVTLGLFDNPNELVNARGVPFFDRTHQFKAIGSYFFPHGFRLSGVIRAQSGQPVTRTFTVSGLNQGTQTIKAEPLGSERLPSVGTADLTIGKDFVMGFGGNGRLTIEGSIFNIFNANTITDINLSSGGAYGNVFNFLSPRIFRIGVKYRF